ncbi:MAG: hypothetical protein HRT47_07685 [Candidatus Caenarcaniphilales bacterium]|nr:hypothetical protein [Candidatus Caenarcaniphilales bacterium]
MTGINPNFNNYGNNGVSPVRANPTGAPSTEVETSDVKTAQSRVAQLKEGIEGSNTLGTVGVEGAGVAGNVVKTENTSQPVQVATTPAASLKAALDANDVFNEIASTEDNFETNFANQSLILAANRANPETLGVEDVLESGAEVADANSLLFEAALV